MTESGPPSAARRALLVLTATLAAALAACVQPVGPARKFDSYEHKAKHTAETAPSAVQTGRLGAQTAKRDDTFAPYLAVLVSNAEDEASSAQTTFDSVQPPNDKSDNLRGGAHHRRLRGSRVSGRVSPRRGDLVPTPVGVGIKDFDRAAMSSSCIARVRINRWRARGTT